MKRINVLLLLLPLTFFGCKKDKTNISESSQEADYDISNSVFRVITQSDVKYIVSIVELNDQNDTLQNVVSNSKAYFNFGFTPKKGSRVVIKGTALEASFFNCTLIYRGERIGLDSVTVSDKALNVNYEYKVKE